MLNPFLKGINQKRLIISIFVMFVFFWLTNFIIHEVLLKGLYEQTMNLWRPREEMGQYLGWMILGQFMIAKYFSVIFAKGYENQGIKEGIRYGLIIGPFSIAPFFIQYSVTPLTRTILWSWVLYGLIQSILGGIVISKVYKK